MRLSIVRKLNVNHIVFIFCVILGIVTITQDYTVCTVGETLSPDQANLLVGIVVFVLQYGT